MKDGRVIEAGSSSSSETGSHVKTTGSLYSDFSGDSSTNQQVKSATLAGKYEIITYNQNSHDYLIISALVIKVYVH